MVLSLRARALRDMLLEAHNSILPDTDEFVVYPHEGDGLRDWSLQHKALNGLKSIDASEWKELDTDNQVSRIHTSNPDSFQYRLTAKALSNR